MNYENMAMDRRRNGSRLSSHDRYHRDPVFSNIVDVLYGLLMHSDNAFTPTELREAVMLAAEKYEYTHVRPMMFSRREILWDKMEKEGYDKNPAMFGGAQCEMPTQTVPSAGEIPVLHQPHSLFTTKMEPPAGNGPSSSMKGKSQEQTTKPNTPR